MATPLSSRKTVEEAREYFADQDPLSLRQYAGLIGAMLLQAATDMIPLEDVLEEIAAVCAVILNEPVRAELNDDGFMLHVGDED